MTEIKLGDLLAAIRNGRPPSPPPIHSTLQGKAFEGPATAGPTPRTAIGRLDILAATAPEDVPDWFRVEFAHKTEVPKPASVLRAEAEAERHDREFAPGAHCDPKWHALRSASVDAVNALATFAEADRRAWQRDVALAAGRDEVHLVCRWRYYWALAMVRAGGVS